MHDAAAKTVFLETMGCQMNVLDSELVAGVLREMGYAKTDAMAEADLVLFNTCSVRQHAEDKVYARLGALRDAKARRPNMVLGVIGCMAQRDAQGIRERMPHVDVLCGPGELERLPDLIAEVEATRRPATALAGTVESRRTGKLARAGEFDSLETLDLARRLQPEDSRVQAYIRVQRGCDKFCTYCVVPFTRGRERSRPPAHVVDEARMLAGAGIKEITLLGQTVNSYVHEEDGRAVGLGRLLEMLHEIDAIQRLRFVTNYPVDFSDDILRAMAELPKVCEYLHVPAQSGSDRILAAMKRGYTADEYLRFIDRARTMVPGLSVAGDFIVGFPGETDEDYAATVELAERVAYKSCFVFKYSPRPGTAGSRALPDDVPDKVKRERNNHLLSIQNGISLRQNREFIGNSVEILVEGRSKRQTGQDARQAVQTDDAERTVQLTGRTRGDRIVVFDGPMGLVGRLLAVEVTDATALTLFGRPHGRGSVVPGAGERISLERVAFQRGVT